MRAVRVAVEREEVIPVEDDVHPDVLAAAHRVPDLVVVGGMLRLKLDSDADGEGHSFSVGGRESRAACPVPGFERLPPRQIQAT